MFAGAVEGGAKAWGETIDKRQEGVEKRGLLAETEAAGRRNAEYSQELSDKSAAAAEGRKDYAIGADGKTVLTRDEYQKLPPDKRAEFIPATAAEAQAAASKLALDERRVSATETQAEAAMRRADAAEDSANRSRDEKVVREVVDGVIYERTPAGEWKAVGGEKKSKTEKLPARVLEDRWKMAVKQAKDEASNKEGKLGFLKPDSKDFPGGKEKWINDKAIEIFAQLSGQQSTPSAEPESGGTGSGKFEDILRQAQSESAAPAN